MIAEEDRKLISKWSEHGMPDDDSTRAYAVRLLERLLAEIDDAWGIVDQLSRDA